MISNRLQQLLNEDHFATINVKNNVWKGKLVIYRNPSRDELFDIIDSLTLDFKVVNIGVDKDGNLFIWRSEIIDDEIEKAKPLGMVWSLIYDVNKKTLDHRYSKKYEGKEITEEGLRTALQKIKGLFPEIKGVSGYYERVHPDFFEASIKKYFPASTFEWQTKDDIKIKRNIATAKRHKDEMQKAVDAEVEKAA